MAAFFISHSSEDQAAVERLRDRLREWGYGSMFLDFDPDDGIAVGREWEQELYAQLHAADAVVFVGSRASVSSRWCFAELALARSARKPIFPVAIEAGVRMRLLDDRQWLELGDGDGADGRLERALRARFDPRDALSWDASRPPYPGLFAFEAGDAGVFFGRDEKVGEVLAHLDATLGRGRCVAVIGASGSGKSSLVRAGVLPRLTRPGDRWAVVGPLTPGERPVAALARALATASGVVRESLARRIEREGLAETLRDLADGGDGGRRSVLVVVDQAEELVVQSDAGERARFLELLRGALGSGVPVWVLATLRSEFLSASLRDPGLVELIQDTVLVGPLDRARLPQVILGPARRARLEFSPGLVERMVADTHGGDALPLLAYTLRELYDRERPDARMITAADYDAIEGVEGALPARRPRPPRPHGPRHRRAGRPHAAAAGHGRRGGRARAPPARPLGADRRGARDRPRVRRRPAGDDPRRRGRRGRARGAVAGVGAAARRHPGLAGAPAAGGRAGARRPPVGRAGPARLLPVARRAPGPGAPAARRRCAPGRDRARVPRRRRGPRAPRARHGQPPAAPDDRRAQRRPGADQRRRAGQPVALRRGSPPGGSRESAGSDLRVAKADHVRRRRPGP